ncbi:MAG TPA: ketopantoate reductase C-terminal domain-containing protein [Streptosporangiaceae bacterium]
MTGLLPVGRYPAGADETARQVAAGLAGSTFLAPVRQDVMRWKYGKLLTNLANAVEAVCGPAGAENGNAAGAAELRRRAWEEGAAVLDAAGIAYSTAAELAELRGDQMRIEAVGGTRRTGGSSWQSLTCGTGSVEADYLNGEIVLFGREHGVPAPVNALLQRLANQFAADHRVRGSVTPGEMAAPSGRLTPRRGVTQSAPSRVAGHHPPRPDGGPDHDPADDHRDHGPGWHRGYAEGPPPAEQQAAAGSAAAGRGEPRRAELVHRDADVEPLAVQEVGDRRAGQDRGHDDL